MLLYILHAMKAAGNWIKTLKLVEKYFDAFLYVTNWETHQLLLRIPRKLIDLALASKYCIGDSWTIYKKGDYLIFDFTSETEDYDLANL